MKLDETHVAMHSGDEPLWRIILNYGSVFYFLGLPAMAVFYGVTHFTFGGESSPKAAEFLREFHFAVTAIVAAVAGLNSFDRRQVIKGNGETKISRGAAEKY